MHSSHRLTHPSLVVFGMWALYSRFNSLPTLLLVFCGQVLVEVVYSDGLLLLHNRAEGIAQSLR